MPAPWSGGAQVRIIGKLHGQETNNVLNFATNTVVNDPQTLAPLLVALATAVLTCVVEHLRNAVTQDWHFSGVEARLLFPTPSDPVFVASQAGSDSGLSGATSVSFAATLVHNRTGLGGRSGRGRIFFPPPGEQQMTESTIEQTSITDYQAMIACIIGKFVGAGATEAWRLGVLSRKGLGTPPNAANFDTAFRETVSLDVAKETSVLSSRRVGRGH